MTRPASVYRLRADDGRLLYVGCSYNVTDRLRDHRQKWWGSAISTVDVEAFATREAAAEAEYEAIVNERPLHNRAIRKEPCLSTPMTPAMAERLRAVGQEHRNAIAERDELIREKAAGGMTYREIAEAVGLSHTAVMFIVRGRTR